MSIIIKRRKTFREWLEANKITVVVEESPTQWTAHIPKWYWRNDTAALGVGWTVEKALNDLLRKVEGTFLFSVVEGKKVHVRVPEGLRGEEALREW